MIFLFYITNINNSFRKVIHDSTVSAFSVFSPVSFLNLTQHVCALILSSRSLFSEMAASNSIMIPFFLSFFIHITPYIVFKFVTAVAFCELLICFFLVSFKTTLFNHIWVHFTSKVHCHVFEDNSGALEMAKIHKYRSRTKHMCIQLHHFRDYVFQKECLIHPIDTSEQPADFLTKSLSKELLEKHCKIVMGW